MKKIVTILMLTLSLNANAGFLDFFDFSKFGQALLLIIDGMNDNLEKIRLVQHEKYDIETQWLIGCRIAVGANQTTVELKNYLEKRNFNSLKCLPLVTALSIQNDIVDRCERFYTEPVPANSDFMFSQLATAIEAVQQIKEQCF